MNQSMEGNKLINRFIALTGCIFLSLSISACSTSEHTESEKVQNRQQQNIDSTTEQKQNNEKEWEIVSRGYRIQGTLNEVQVQNNKLNRITIKAIKNMPIPNNPVDYDFVGQTLQIDFQNTNLESTTLEKFKIGTDLVLVIEQADKNGEVVWTSNPDYIYFVTDNGYEDLQGNKVTEHELKPNNE